MTQNCVASDTYIHTKQRASFQLDWNSQINSDLDKNTHLQAFKLYLAQNSEKNYLYDLFITYFIRRITVFVFIQYEFPIFDDLFYQWSINDCS